MTKREAALRRLSAAEFAAWDLHLYLDTHPWDTQAMERYALQRAKAGRLRSEFETQFYPLSEASGNAWIKTPWPWNDPEGGR